MTFIYDKILKFKIYLLRLRGYKIKIGQKVIFQPGSNVIFPAGKRFNNINIGNGTIIGRNTIISVSNNSNVSIGDNVCFRDNNYIEVGKNSNLKIGDHSFLNRCCQVVCMNDIEIGKHVAIGTNVSFFDHDHIVVPNKPNDWAKSKYGKIIIGNDVWIGANSLILRDTKIGDNSVLAGGTVFKGELQKNLMIYQKKEKIIKPIEG